MNKKWSIKFISLKAEKEIISLNPTLQAKFLRIGELLIEFGPNNVGMPHCKFLEKGL